MNPTTFAHLRLVVPALLLACLGCETAASGGPVEPKFSSLYDNYFNGCKQCHAPGAAGATSGTEKNLNFASAATAWQSLTGSAAGLTGNQTACNGVAFVSKGNPGKSLLLAAIDADTRKGFDLPGTPGCDNNAISDMAFKMNLQPSAEVLAALKTWISNGAAND